MSLYNLPFYFHHEYIEDTRRGNSPTVDIGTIKTETYNDKSFFSLEAKRLPPPTKNREKEYVSGKSGGVERFKKEIHGQGLFYCAIIGYIQEHDFDYWFRQINKWMDDLNWNEQLEEISISDMTSRYFSVHQRKVDRISLYHLWVKLF